jgi:hypothetical protein
MLLHQKTPQVAASQQFLMKVIGTFPRGQQYVIDYLRGFSKIHFVLSGFAPHLASHFGRSVSKHSYSYVSQPINQTVLPATLQIPDPSCNMRVSRDCYEVYHQNRG